MTFVLRSQRVPESTNKFSGQQEDKCWKPQRTSYSYGNSSDPAGGWSLRNEEGEQWGGGRGKQASDQGKFYERLKSFSCIIWGRHWKVWSREVWSGVIQQGLSSLWREGCCGSGEASDCKETFALIQVKTRQSHGGDRTRAKCGKNELKTN